MNRKKEKILHEIINADDSPEVILKKDGNGKYTSYSRYL